MNLSNETGPDGLLVKSPVLRTNTELKLLHKIDRGITLPNFLWSQYYLDTKTRKQDKTTKEENYRLVSLVNTEI